MAQSYDAKQKAFLGRLSQATVQLMQDADSLRALTIEFQNCGYGSGGENTLTDPVVQGKLPATTAQEVFFAVGQLANDGEILDAIGAARAGLEALRP